jgi:hypothetical protein
MEFIMGYSLDGTQNHFSFANIFGNVTLHMVPSYLQASISPINALCISGMKSCVGGIFGDNPLIQKVKTVALPVISTFSVLIVDQLFSSVNGAEESVEFKNLIGFNIKVGAFYCSSSAAYYVCRSRFGSSTGK